MPRNFAGNIMKKLGKKKSLLIAIPVVIILLIGIGIGIFFIILGTKNSVCFFHECVHSVTEKYESLELDEICMAKKCLYKKGNESQSSPVCIPQSCVLDKDHHSLETTRICISRPCLIKDDPSVVRNRTISHCKGEDCPAPLSEPRRKEVCATEDCTMAAAKMLRWMDQKIKPCDDFYSFSCNGFIHKYKRGEEKEAYSIEDLAEEATSNIIREILESPNTGNESDALQKARAVFQTCVGEGDALKNYNYKSLKEILLRNGIEKWPLLEGSHWARYSSRSDCQIDLEWRMAMLNAYGVDSLFHLAIDFKGMDSISYVGVHISQPLVKDVCSENATVAATNAANYKEMLGDVLDLLGVSRDHSDIENIVTFDTDLCRIMQGSQKEEKIQKIPELNFVGIRKLFPDFNWKRWKNILLDKLEIDEKLKDSSIYVYGDEQVIKDITKLYVKTDSRIIANYLTWKFVFSYLSFLGDSFRKIVLKYSSFFDDWRPYFFIPDPSASVKISCGKYVEKKMNIALIPRFLSKVNTPGVKKEVNNLIFLIKESFKETFYNNDELDMTDKKKMINKTETVDVVFSYPDGNESFYDEYYSSMDNFGNSFLENGMMLSMFHQKKLFEAVINGSNHTDLELQALIRNPFRTNAIVAFRENKLVLYLGELLISGVSHKLPQYLNFGSFGWIVAHELAYGFNPLFSSYNDVHRNIPGNWTVWPSYIVELIRERARCFIKNSYESDLDPVPVEENGNGTLAAYEYDEGNQGIENIFKENETFAVNEYAVDNQGIEEAFKSYRSYEKWHGSETKLPGLHYSGEQLFFIKYAQLWCSFESAKHKEENDACHLNSERCERVNGVLRNVEAFSEVFNCPPNSPMNSPKKCQNFW